MTEKIPRAFSALRELHTDVLIAELGFRSGGNQQNLLNQVI